MVFGKAHRGCCRLKVSPSATVRVYLVDRCRDQIMFTDSEEGLGLVLALGSIRSRAVRFQVRLQECRDTLLFFIHGRGRCQVVFTLYGVRCTPYSRVNSS